MRRDDLRAYRATQGTGHHLHPEFPPPVEAKQWITRAEAAEILGITAGGVGHFVQRGDLHPRPKSRHRPTLDRAEVQRLADARGEQAARRQPKIPRQPRHPQDGHTWLSALPYTVGPQGRRSYRVDHVELFASDIGLPMPAARQATG